MKLKGGNGKEIGLILLAFVVFASAIGGLIYYFYTKKDEIPSPSPSPPPAPAPTPTPAPTPAPTQEPPSPPSPCDNLNWKGKKYKEVKGNVPIQMCGPASSYRYRTAWFCPENLCGQNTNGTNKACGEGWVKNSDGTNKVCPTGNCYSPGLYESWDKKKKKYSVRWGMLPFAFADNRYLLKEKEIPDKGERRVSQICIDGRKASK